MTKKSYSSPELRFYSIENECAFLMLSVQVDEHKSQGYDSDNIPDTGIYYIDFDE